MLRLFLSLDGAWAPDEISLAQPLTDLGSCPIITARLCAMFHNLVGNNDFRRFLVFNSIAGYGPAGAFL